MSTSMHCKNITAAAAKSLQLCPTLCDPIDSSPPGSAVPGILQARTLEWVAIAFSIVWKWKVKVKSLSRVQLVATPWTAAYQAPPSMGFSRQEYWSGLPLPSPLHHLAYGKLLFYSIICVKFLDHFIIHIIYLYPQEGRINLKWQHKLKKLSFFTLLIVPVTVRTECLK